MVLRDLELVLLAARRADVPLIIGSAGTAGARPHLQATLALVQHIAERHQLPMVKREAMRLAGKVMTTVAHRI